MIIVRQIPNALTCCNLLCGCIGIAAIMQGWNVAPAYFVWAACVFDFLDGFAARMLRVSSPMGKELDSLADMVSFGLLPSILMFQMLQVVSDSAVVTSMAFILAVFSAWRLAQFNIDTRQTDGFIGVPTPATALLITGLPFLSEAFAGFEWTVPTLLAVTVVSSLLMVSPFPLFSLKFKSFGWAGNQLRFTFLAISVLLFAWIGKSSIVAIIILYIVLSLITRALKRGVETSK